MVLSRWMVVSHPTPRLKPQARSLRCWRGILLSRYSLMPRTQVTDTLLCVAIFFLLTDDYATINIPCNMHLSHIAHWHAYIATIFIISNGTTDTCVYNRSSSQLCMILLFYFLKNILTLEQATEFEWTMEEVINLMAWCTVPLISRTWSVTRANHNTSIANRREFLTSFVFF
jgi:hypothetical protein